MTALGISLAVVCQLLLVIGQLLLKHGTVTFQCDPHKAIMNGSFTVGGTLRW